MRRCRYSQKVHILYYIDARARIPTEMSTSLVPVLTFTEKTIVLRCNPGAGAPVTKEGRLTVELFSTDGKLYRARETYEPSPRLTDDSVMKVRWCSHSTQSKYSELQRQEDTCMRASWQLKQKATLQGCYIGSRTNNCLAADNDFLQDKWAAWRAFYISAALLRRVQDLSCDVRGQVLDWLVRLARAELTVEFPCY